MDKINDLLQFNTWGTLSVITDDNHPIGIPMNYVTYRNQVFFHSVPHTQIAKLTTQEMCFSCVDELSFIPGAWMTLSGNPGIGTVFYRSVLIFGQPGVIDNVVEKSEILNHLCEKFEPVGNYKKIYPTNLAIKKMTIWGLDTSKAVYRARLGENLGQAVQKRIIHNLKERNTVLDQRTIALMERR